MEQELRQAIKELNEDANSRWENERILSISSYRENEDSITFTLECGKFNTTYHDIVCKDGNVIIENESCHNDIAEDVIEHIIAPLYER